MSELWQSRRAFELKFWLQPTMKHLNLGSSSLGDDLLFAWIGDESDRLDDEVVDVDVGEREDDNDVDVGMTRLFDLNFFEFLAGGTSLARRFSASSKQFDSDWNFL